MRIEVLSSCSLSHLQRLEQAFLVYRKGFRNNCRRKEKREGGVRKGKVGGGSAFHASQYTWHLLFSSRRRPQARC